MPKGNLRIVRWMNARPGRILVLKRTFVVGLLIAVAGFAGAIFKSAERVGAFGVADATIIGKVVKADGTAISFTCMVPPGQPVPSQPCGVWVQVDSGPGGYGVGEQANTTTGAFTVRVPAGKYNVNFNGPMEVMGQYSFTSKTVEITSGQTVDLGTITAGEKNSTITGTVQLADGTAVSGARVMAFTMFNGPQEGSEGPKNNMPSMGTTAANGTFSMKVDCPGRFGVGMDQSPDSQYVLSGQQGEVSCTASGSVMSGVVLTAVKADVTITGAVKDSAGNNIFFNGGVQARPVGSTSFINYNGPIQPEGPMGGPGSPQPTSSKYTIRVPSSSTQYQLSVMTPPDVSYSLATPVIVTVTPNSTVTQDLALVKDTSSIFGKIVSDSGFALNSCNASGEGFGGAKFGEVFANNEKLGKFTHSFIGSDCTYKITVAAGEYNVGYRINSKDYINKQAPPTFLKIPNNTDVEYNITVTAGDATITGTVVDNTGKPMVNVWVNADTGRENEKEFQSGGQEKSGGKNAGEFKGPGGTKTPEEAMKYCKTHKAECEKMKLPPGATGPGGCTDMYACTQYCAKNPQVCNDFDKNKSDTPTGLSKGTKVFGQSAKYLRMSSVSGRKVIKADVQEKEGEGPDFNQKVINAGINTDNSGKFTLKVLSGHTYQVRAGLPPDRDTGLLIAPKAVTVDLKTVKTATIALQFLTAFGTMTGKVTMPDGSAASQCFVHFWNENGEDGGSGCRPDGTYTLGYNQGILHVEANSFSGSKPYRSDEVLLSITTQKTLTQNFAMKQQDFKMPQPVSQTIDASEANTVTADDGTELIAPAGCIKESGDVRIDMVPTVNLKATSSKKPVGAGMSFTATDASSGEEIDTFACNVTIKLPYDESYIKNKLGLDERLLKSAYKDDSGSLKDADAATQDTTENKFTVTSDHFSDWTTVAPSGLNLKSVSVSSSGKNTKIKVGTKTFTVPGAKANWNVGTANFGTIGQLVVVSNKTTGNSVFFYNTNGKKVKTLSLGGATGLNQQVDDVAAKSGSAPDGTKDVVIAPAKSGPAKALVIQPKNKYQSQSITTGTSAGTTTLSTAELATAGMKNLTTLSNGKTSKAWKMSKGKMVEMTGSSVKGSLSVKNGKVEKKVETPKVSKISGKCSQTSSSTIKLIGKGFGTSSPVVLINGATAVSATITKTNTEMKITLNPEAMDVNAVNTATIVNSDGMAGVKVITCGT